MRPLPILALDVDGPIVVFGSDSGWETTADGIPVTIPKAVPRRLQRLALHYQIVWYTSWTRTASLKIAPLVGLPAGLPFLDLKARAKPGESRKFPALRRWIGDRPLAVVDDEIGLDMRDWAEARAEPTLLVEVDPRRGLQESHVIALLVFAKKLLSRVV